MTSPYLLGDIASDEGLRLKAYPDAQSPRGRELAKPAAQRQPGCEKFSGAPWTIGYGHCGPEVHEGLTWSLEQASAALAADVDRAKDLLDANLSWWRSLNDARQDVLVNMCFNMGWDDPKTEAKEGLSSFVNTLAAIRAGDYGKAGTNMLQSKWSRQVGKRAFRLATQMRTGVRVAP